MTKMMKRVKMKNKNLLYFYEDSINSPRRGNSTNSPVESKRLSDTNKKGKAADGATHLKGGAINKGSTTNFQRAKEGGTKM